MRTALLVYTVFLMRWSSVAVSWSLLGDGGVAAIGTLGLSQSLVVKDRGGKLSKPYTREV